MLLLGVLLVLLLDALAAVLDLVLRADQGVADASILPELLMSGGGGTGAGPVALVRGFAGTAGGSLKKPPSTRAS